MSKSSFQRLEHTADIQIRIQADSFQNLLRQAADAMMELIFGEETCELSAGKAHEVQVEGHDNETLLVAWLSELLYLTQTEYCAVTKCQLDLPNEHELRAQVQLVPCEAREDIKAVTYHGLQVEEHEGTWTVEIVFDI